MIFDYLLIILEGRNILFQDGRLRPISSVKYERALIDIKSMIKTTTKIMIRYAITLSYCKNFKYKLM